MTIHLGAGELFVGPLGGDLVSLGFTSGALSFDPAEEWLEHPLSPLRSATVCFSWPVRAMSWRTYRLLFQRTHPGARRVHRDYARRLRARRRRARR